MKARRVWGLKSWASRNEVNRWASSGGMGRGTLSAGFFTGCLGEVDTMMTLLVLNRADKGGYQRGTGGRCHSPHMPLHSPVVIGSSVFGARAAKSIMSSGTHER